jgi:hypothetical protein
MAHINGCFDSLEISTIKQALNTFIDNSLRCALGQCGEQHDPEHVAGVADDVAILRHFILHLDDAVIEASIDEELAEEAAQPQPEAAVKARVEELQGH